MVIIKDVALGTYLTARRRSWYLIDANNQLCGRLSQLIGKILQGKTKPIYHHSHDDGDYLVIINCKYIQFVGETWYTKIYRHYTGMPGGMKEKFIAEISAKDPCRIIWRAVYGMLPKNNTRIKMINRLFLFEADIHPFIESELIEITPSQSLPPRITQFTKNTIKNYPFIVKKQV